MNTDVTLPEMADALSRMPPIFMGLNIAELNMVTVLAFTLALPVLVGVWAVWAFMPGFIGYLLITMALMITGIFRLQSYKTGRPDGYYQIKLLLLQVRWLGGKPLIDSSLRFGKNRKVVRHD